MGPLKFGGPEARGTNERRGSTMTQPDGQPIHLEYPDAPELQLRITMGPGQLRISPSEGSAWATGIYRDPTGNIPLRVETDGGKARIGQTVSASSLRIPRAAPLLELQLGTARPFALIIEGGANEIAGELGGIPLTRLECRFGAGQAKLGFGEPNPVAMDRLQLGAGAADLRLNKLANANAAEITVEGGAASFQLDFGGTLQRDARARINAGMVGMEILVPAQTAAKIAPHATLGGVDAGDGFTTREGGYWTPGAVSGSTPALTIDATVALSGIKLRLT